MTTITYATEHGFTLLGTEQGAWMDDTDPTTDLTSNSNPMTEIGTLTKSATVVGGDSFQYSGFSVSDYLHRAYDADFDLIGIPPTAGHTLMAWVNVGASTTTETIIDRQDTGGTGAGYRLRLESNKTFSSIVDDGTDSHTVTSDIATAVEGWVFVVATWDGVDTQSIYINGVLDNQHGGGGAVGSLVNGTAVLRIGIRATGADPCNQGLAMVKILSSPVAPQQILQVYNNEKVLVEPYAKYATFGDEYAIVFPAQGLTRSSTGVRKTADSIGGNRQVIFNREDIMWDILSSEITLETVNLLQLMLSATVKGTTITVDLYDLGAELECILLNDSYTTTRIATSEYFTIGFKVREV